jgi:hypothetical protein
LPQVHLGIDPEFSQNGHVPGTKIGSFTAGDINDAIDILAKVVRENKLPPKVLVVHRFTQGMITDYKKIKKLPEVQVVMDMDGFGSRVLKRSTYLTYIYREPVMFTGFKLFYKMTIGIIQKCTLLKSCCNSHQNQATFNFTPSHEKLFRLSVPRTSCYGRLSIQIKRNSRSGPSKYLLRIKW